MLCGRCRRQTARDAIACENCGAAAKGRHPEFDVVLPDGTRVPLADALSVGRGAANALRLDDPSASRTHARLTRTPEGPVLEDLGSRFGTFADGVPVRRALLRPGSRARIGDTELRLAERQGALDGRTVVVRPGATLAVSAVSEGPRAVAEATLSAPPRLRSGWAIKGGVLKDLRTGKFLQLQDGDARLVLLLDGERSLDRLALDAEALGGPDGPARLAALLADLAERGLISGIAGADTPPDSRLGRLTRPRRHAWPGAGALIDRLYAAGGWLLFSQGGLMLLAVVALSGLAVFATQAAAGTHTPFVVGHQITVGSAVFVAGRFALAGVHELAHGLTMASFGRRVSSAGLKCMLLFPYLFVDTSDAWFERRRRRLAVAAAGPVSDLTLGGSCALLALTTGGIGADIAFQLACGAYVGALYNLNPLLERDGYHMLADALGQPALRTRARRRVVAVLACRPRTGGDGRVLTAYGAASFGWSLVAAALMITAINRYRGALEAHLGTAVYALLTPLYAAAVLPVALAVAVPLAMRFTPRRRAH